MMFWRKKQPEKMPVRDVQQEVVQAILMGAHLLPSKRFANVIYTSIADSRQITTQDIDDLANRLSRLAWERGRG